jgi:hypothetical protein
MFGLGDYNFLALPLAEIDSMPAIVECWEHSKSIKKMRISFPKENL